MLKLKSMITKCTLKWFYCWGLFFCSFLLFSSIVEAEEVKYFGGMSCGIFKYDDKCIFGREIDSSDLAKAWGYYEVHYKDGQLTNAIRVNKFKLDEEPPSVSEKLEFNCEGRLIYQETNLHEHSQYDPILYKRSYNQQNYDLQIYDKAGKLMVRESHIYKDNMLVKRLVYDESEKLIEYSTFNHDSFIEKVFTPDHKLQEERDMGRYFD
jgi:hypothetical protein